MKNKPNTLQEEIEKIIEEYAVKSDEGLYIAGEDFQSFGKELNKLFLSKLQEAQKEYAEEMLSKEKKKIDYWMNMTHDENAEMHGREEIIDKLLAKLHTQKGI
jgi:hypothetical protein